jgi:hypothetical protein
MQHTKSQRRIDSRRLAATCGIMLAVMATMVQAQAEQTVAACSGRRRRRGPEAVAGGGGRRQRWGENGFKLPETRAPLYWSGRKKPLIPK